MPVRKGSHSPWKAKLTRDQVLEAYKLMHTKGWTCGQTAIYFRVARSTMISIRRGHSWAWLTGHRKNLHRT